MKAYIVYYTATRSGSTKTNSAFYRIDGEIDSADKYAHMVADIQRHAVSSGHANNVDDVVITSCSLLNPTAAAGTEVEAQQRDTADIEGQLSELRSAILTVKNTIADPKMKQADKIKYICELLQPY